MTEPQGPLPPADVPAGPPPPPIVVPPPMPLGAVLPPTGAAPTTSWAAATAGPRPSRRPWVIGCLALIVVLVLAIGGCVALVWRGFGGAALVVANSNGQIDSFNVFSGTSGTSITFTAARGLDIGDGPRLACDIVRPTLAGTDLANAEWIIVNRAGDVIASNRTPCPAGGSDT